MIEALLLAAFLHRPPVLVQQVYTAGGVDAVAVVEMESNFDPKAIREEPREHTSFGLFQIDSEWWPQYRHDLHLHIQQGIYILTTRPGSTLAIKISHYNGGTHPGPYSIAWGKRVQAKRDELVRWLSWRFIRDLGVVTGG